MMRIACLMLALGMFTVAAAAPSDAERVLSSAKKLESSTYWSTVSPECENAFKVATGDKTAAPAKERLKQIRVFKNCLSTQSSQMAALVAESPTAMLLQDAATRPLLEATAEDEAEAAAETAFMGFSFGVGVGISYSEDEIVSEADLGSGNVIIPTKSSRELPRVILESHYYGWCHRPECNAAKFGVGPYFGIVAKSDKLISAFSMGVMVGWKDATPTDRDGFSIGFGVLLDDEIKSLADGFEPGKPLPAGETAIRFEEKPRWSAILFFTRTF